MTRIAVRNIPYLRSLACSLIMLGSAACGDTVAPEPRLALPTLDRIVFERVGADSLGDVLSMRMDGSDMRRLTSPLVNERCPSISPDGNWIAYYVVANRSQGDEIALWLMRANGEEPRPIAVIGHFPHCPIWSRASDVVEVTSSFTLASPSRPTVQLFDLAGNQLQRFETVAYQLYEFSPSGQEFLGSASNCSSDGCTPAELLVSMRDGTFVRWFTGGVQNGVFVYEGGSQGSISPDGSFVVYVCTDGRDANSFPIPAICSKRWDGTGRTVLADGASGWPSFSPDGTRIVFTCRQTNGPQQPTAGLCIMDIDGSNRIDAPTLSVYGVPSWTADGTRVVYACERTDICVFEPETATVSNLTNNQNGTSANPSVPKLGG